jgi:hypothetical protein
MKSLEGEYISKNGNYGDAMSANAACALAFPDDPRPFEYTSRSFIGNRPFRSPFHAADPNVDPACISTRSRRRY